MNEDSLLNKLNNLNVDKEKLFKNAVKEQNYQKAAELNLSFIKQLPILEDLIIKSIKDEGDLAIWIIDNFEGQKYTHNDIITFTIYNHMTVSSENLTKIENLKSKYELDNIQINEIALKKIKSRHFVGYLNVDKYLDFVNQFIPEPEKNKEAIAYAAAFFLYHDSSSNPKGTRKLIDKFKLTKEDLGTVPARGVSFYGGGFYEALENYIEYYISSKKAYDSLIQTLPEFKDEIDSMTRKNLDICINNGKSRRSNVPLLYDFEKYWDFAMELKHNSFYSEDKQILNDRKKSLILKFVNECIEKNYIKSAFEFVDKYKTELSIDNALYERLKTESAKSKNLY